MNKIWILLLISVIAVGCRKLHLSKVPKITYKNMVPQQLIAGDPSQRTTVFLEVEDGDGDIGFEKGNLIFKDSRDSSIQAMVIPVIPQEYGPKNGIRGTIAVEFRAALLTLRPDTIHFNKDTLRWEIYMTDEAGNISNTIYTDSLYLFR
jgi:hypothetical protein